MKMIFFLLSLLCLASQAVNGEEPQPTLTITIPMRDGTELPTDLYLPSPEARNLPCILLRSPSGRKGYLHNIIELIKEGYVVAIQETRSALDSEGKTFPFVSDGWGKYKDGYDTVEWLAQ